MESPIERVEALAAREGIDLITATRKIFWEFNGSERLWLARELAYKMGMPPREVIHKLLAKPLDQLFQPQCKVGIEGPTRKKSIVGLVLKVEAVGLGGVVMVEILGEGLLHLAPVAKPLVLGETIGISKRSPGMGSPLGIQDFSVKGEVMEISSGNIVSIRAFADELPPC